ncbi:MAG: sugar kinase [Comamonadaceae bacterium]|nr:MAG: sugar kinase [Comamonadaceae bacterium]
MRGERRVILVVRQTRLQELVARHNTLAQARFYLEHLGADFADYLREDEAYSSSLRVTVEALEAWGRYQVVDRSLLANFVFDRSDIVVALGQDGLVANTMKYLDGQPLVGLNPEASRWDGILLPFEPRELGPVLPEVAADRRPTRSVTMAEALLGDGQRLLAVNDLFIGPRTHTSALYEISHAGRTELQSSSGLIVSTGMGSTAWMKSIVTGSVAIAAAMGAQEVHAYAPSDWDAPTLTFAVREPFPSRTSQVNLVFGRVDAREPLRLRSRMPEHGVIFSDGMENDFLRFTAGMEAQVAPAQRRGCLVL